MKKWVLSIGLLVIGFALCLGGFYVGETDDAPGAAFIGLVCLLICILLSIKLFRKFSKPIKKGK